MDTYEDLAARMRRDIFLAALGAGKAHLASSFSLVEIMIALYPGGVLRFDAGNPDWEGRDSLILSKGHGSLALYAVLCHQGALSRGELMGFCQEGSILGGEPVVGVPGIEATTGSLGHGLSLGVGEALVYKIDRKGNRVFVILGDGECEEGSVWEAAMSAARFGLDNLTVILDANGVQKMGSVGEISGIEDWEVIWKALGWAVWRTDGHDVEGLIGMLRSTLVDDSRPHIVIADTVKGKGSSLMEGSHSWHWRLPKKKEMRSFMEDLGITEEEVEACKRHM